MERPVRTLSKTKYELGDQVKFIGTSRILPFKGNVFNLGNNRIYVVGPDIGLSFNSYGELLGQEHLGKLLIKL